jgi:hypothetical protein
MSVLFGWEVEMGYVGLYRPASENRKDNERLHKLKLAGIVK